MKQWSDVVDQLARGGALPHGGTQAFEEEADTLAALVQDAAAFAGVQEAHLADRNWGGGKLVASNFLNTQSALGIKPFELITFNSAPSF